MEINWSFISFILSPLWGCDEQPALTINRITFKQWANKQTKHNHWLLLHWLLDFFFFLSCFCFWRVNFSEKKSFSFIKTDFCLRALIAAIASTGQSTSLITIRFRFLEMTLQGSWITVDYETSQLPSEVRWNQEATGLHACAKKDWEENRQQLWVQLHKRSWPGCSFSLTFTPGWLLSIVAPWSVLQLCTGWWFCTIRMHWAVHYT